jgi:hypothetical protein
MRSTCLPAMARSICLSRRDIFGDDSIDRPDQSAGSAADKDSDTPQIGYIGPRYQAEGVVAVDGRSTSRNPGNQMLMPALECFRERCDETTYLCAIEVAQVVSQGWSIWRKHVHPWLEAVRLDADQIAYLNVNPFRTKSQSKFVPEVWGVCWQLHLALCSKCWSQRS